MFVLSNGSIQRKFATSLTAALLLSGMGATVTGAQPLGDTPESKESAAVIAETANTPSSIQGVSISNDSTPARAIASNSPSGLNGAQTEIEPNGDIQVHAHEIDGRRAATLYVKNIPVLTFIGTEVGSLSNSSDAIALAATDSSGLAAEAAPAGNVLDPDLELDPVLRASALGEKLVAQGLEAAELAVRWNEENEGYIVTLADEDLISLDSRTVLPDTTEDSAEDALQVTNRLRRLLGNAEPVTEIEGLPEPEVIEVAPVEQVAIISTNVGAASWYGPGFDGRLTASGEVFNQYALTAAHRTLPFGSRVLVTNLNNGLQVTVRITDRGPFSGDRVIDLSAGAAEEIGLISSGTGTVQLDVLGN
jgi:rare lipoprotein A